jgi:hypothetical protein
MVEECREKEVLAHRSETRSSRWWDGAKRWPYRTTCIRAGHSAFVSWSNFLEFALGPRLRQGLRAFLPCRGKAR